MIVSSASGALLSYAGQQSWKGKATIMSVTGIIAKWCPIMYCSKLTGCNLRESREFGGLVSARVPWYKERPVGLARAGQRRRRPMSHCVAGDGLCPVTCG